MGLRDKDGIDCWPAQMRSVFDVANGYSALNKGCLARFPSEPWKCLFPEYYADLLKSRMLPLNSFYDSSEIGYTLRLSCCVAPCSGWEPFCNATEQELLLALRGQH